MQPIATRAHNIFIARGTLRCIKKYFSMITAIPANARARPFLMKFPPNTIVIILVTIAKTKQLTKQIFSAVRFIFLSLFFIEVTVPLLNNLLKNLTQVEYQILMIFAIKMF